MLWKVKMTPRIDFLNITHRIEQPFWKWLKESNPFFWTQLKKLNFCWKNTKNDLLKNSKKSNHLQKKMTQRIEPSFQYVWMNWTHLIDDSQNWTLFWKWFTEFIFFEIRMRLTELNLFSLIWLFFKKSQIIEFFSMTQRIESLFMNLFSIWLKDMKFFFSFDKELKPFVFSKCLTELNLSFIWATFVHDSKNWIIFNMTQRFFKLTQKSWTHFFSMTQRNDLVSPKWRTELNPYFEYDAKNGIWRKELNPFSLNMTQRIELFV